MSLSFSKTSFNEDHRCCWPRSKPKSRLQNNFSNIFFISYFLNNVFFLLVRFFVEQELVMTTITVEIKWGNNIYKDVLIDFNEDPSDFKARLFSLTNVPPERQKCLSLVYFLFSYLTLLVMLKGGPLKDTWAPFKNSLKTVCLFANSYLLTTIRVNALC